MSRFAFGPIYHKVLLSEIFSYSYVKDVCFDHLFHLSKQSRKFLEDQHDYVGREVLERVKHREFYLEDAQDKAYFEIFQQNYREVTVRAHNIEAFKVLLPYF